ncbi:M16 family metallopeptidase [Gabonibacter chumensis]|uniref:M16 family metallopeptidase n=1 Tax=Gabonibacter chumensis TaxID=2972474 RepID=UPI0025737D5A|nr:pitrilysin family protein [Gabonibacter chumensis]MCR9011754.1 insulinase family protein [Gabonibacter chumensis]
MNRNRPPQLEALTKPSVLNYQKRILSNGIEIIYINDPQQEVFKMDVVLPVGAYYQPRPIIASTMLHLLNEGTRSHSSEMIAEFFDYHGAYVDYNCGLHKSEISLISLNKYADKTIGMVAEMIADSIFPEHELEVYLRNKKQQYLVNLEKTSYLARMEFLRLFFGEQHPYANHFTREDFDQVTRRRLLDFYQKRVSAPNCRIFLSGNVNESVLQEVGKRFSALQSTVPEEEPTYDIKRQPAGLYRIHKPDAVQTSIRVGKKGVRLTEEDYTDFQLLNMVLGGYFGSRLMSNIREEKGFTYGIGSFNVSMKNAAYWNIATDVNADHAEATISEIRKEILRLQQEPIPTEELNLVKSFFHGELLRELDGVFAQSDALKHKLNYDTDNTFYLKMIDRMKECTPEDLLQTAQKHLNMEEMYFVEAGKS